MKRYRTIVADPPWDIGFKRIGVGGRRTNPTEVPYSYMGLDAIKALPVAEWADPKAHLYLWTTRELFREGKAAEVVRAWGFQPCGEIIWGLRNAGMGGFLGSGHEPIILGARGELSWPKNEIPHGVEFWRQLYLRGKVHSAKPEAFLDRVEQWSPGPYLELFARRARFGWDYWGDESLGNVEMSA
jgi:N6-adenosine-specific RNA methylase IME4